MKTKHNFLVCDLFSTLAAKILPHPFSSSFSLLFHLLIYTFLFNPLPHSPLPTLLPHRRYIFLTPFSLLPHPPHPPPLPSSYASIAMHFFFIQFPSSSPSATPPPPLPPPPQLYIFLNHFSLSILLPPPLPPPLPQFSSTSPF